MKDYQLSIQSPAGYVIGGEEKHGPLPAPDCTAVCSHQPVLWGAYRFLRGGKNMDMKLQ